MDVAPVILPDPPSWSLALGIVGRALVWIAVVAFLASAIGWLLSPKLPWLARPGKWGFSAGALALFSTFGVLAVLFASNRLEYEYVWGHGDGSNTLPYRIAGIWAGQEGSFLLWACASALFGLLAVGGTGPYRRWFTIVFAVFLGAIAGILAYETPFNLNMLDGRPVVPEEGVGLSPSLQNYWVTIHPPTIFLGFGSLTVLAAYAFAALATGSVHSWITMVRPWAIIAMTLVGVGLCMGGFWAYETLGWGGFWMWDPVENVSFVPWVMSVSFVHGIMVQLARKRWIITNLLLGGLPFLLFVYGTFLTRSGALSETSVHSFAEMDSLAHKLLLGFMVCSTAGFLALFVWRAIRLQGSLPKVEAPRSGFHREAFFRVGAILMSMLGLATAIGMSVPLFMALAGKEPSVVEENMYHRVLVWMFVPMMLTMAAAPLVAWSGQGWKDFFRRMYGVLCVTLTLAGLSMIAVSATPWLRGVGFENQIRALLGRQIDLVPWVLFLTALCSAVIVGSMWRIVELFRRSKVSAAAFLSHAAVALLMAGLIVSRGFERKQQLIIQDGSHDLGLGYLVSYKGRTGDVLDRNNKLLFELRRGKETLTVAPGMYYIPRPDGTIQTMVWPAIVRYPLHDIYFALQPPVTDASDAVVLRPGESVKMERFNVKFLRMTRDGNAGMAGTRFGALVEVTNGPHKSTVNPTIELTREGMVEHPAALASAFKLRLKSIDAATGGVTLQLQYAKALYPIEMYYKPLTNLVWGGTGLFAISGFVAAWYRRRPRAWKPREPEESENGSPEAQE